jgi:hypothetical protein
MKVIKAIGEYVDLVKNGIKNGDKIIEAIRTSAKIKEQKNREKLGLPAREGDISAEEIAEILRRKEICAGCSFNSENAKKERGYSSSLTFIHCTLCKCRIAGEDSKEYCLDCSCGVEAWNNRNSHLPPMELKWKAFENNK